MKSIYNALHSDDYLDGKDDDGSGNPGVLTLWYPYDKSRGGPLTSSPLRRAASWAARGNDGRQ